MSVRYQICYNYKDRIMAETPKSKNIVVEFAFGFKIHVSISVRHKANKICVPILVCYSTNIDWCWVYGQTIIINTNPNRQYTLVFIRHITKHMPRVYSRRLVSSTSSQIVGLWPTMCWTNFFCNAYQFKVLLYLLPFGCNLKGKF